MARIFWGTLLYLLCHLPVQGGEIALIIDDMGYRQQEITAFDLPVPVTFSILPHTPFSGAFADKAATQRREVMLHVPMEALGGNKLGPGGITANMSSSAIQSELRRALADVPNAQGINNHMGSKLTQLSMPMTATMEFLQQQDLYFVDSRTTRYSKAEAIAKTKGVPALHRNIFLDHFRDERHMQLQLQRLVRIAKKYKRAIGIAHPFPETLAFLQQQLPLLEEQGIKLVPLSSLLPQGQALAKNHQPAD